MYGWGWLRWARMRAAYLAIAGLAALALVPAMRTGQWAFTHERARYALLFGQFRAAVLRGHLYPRWLPDLYGGYGYPNFCFYQPGFFYTALPFSVLPSAPPLWLYATTWTILFAGGAGAYLLARRVAARAGAKLETGQMTGLFAAALFLMTPYLWVDLYVRGDMSELMALCLTPWPLFGLLRLADKVERGMPALGSVFLCGASLAAIVLSHPIVAMFALPVFAVMALAVGGSRRRVYPRAALALGLGLALSSIYWYPLATLRSQVGMDRATAGFYAAQGHIVVPWQLLSNAWGFGGSIPGDGDQMSFQLGLVHLVLATAGLVVGRKDRALRAAYVLYLGLAAVMTAAGLPLWKNVGLFKLVQFPWRMLAALAALQVMCAAGLAAAHVSHRTRVVGLTVVLLAGALWHGKQFAIEKPMDLALAARTERQEGVRSRMTNYAAENEFLPRTAPARTGLRPRGDSVPILALPPGVRDTRLPGDDEFLIHRRIEAAGAATVTINQLYFIGWKVEVDGAEVPAADLRRQVDREGRMTLALPAGAHTLRATYDGPPGWRWRTMGVLLMLVLFGASWWRERAAGRPR